MRGIDSRLTRMGLLALAYLVTARLGLLLATTGGNATPLWLPPGLTLALVLLLGSNALPGAMIGATVASLLAGSPFPVAAIVGVGSTLEAGIAARLIRRYCSPGDPFRSPRDIVAFGLVSTLACALGASVGALGQGLGQVIPVVRIVPSLGTSWLGDCASIFMLTPLTLTWVSDLRTKPRWRVIRGDFLHIAAAFPLGLFLFWNAESSASHDILPYLLLPVVVWAAFHFDRRKVLTGSTLVAVAAIAATHRGLGPFHAIQAANSLLVLQAFLAIVSLTGLAVSALVEERRRGEEEIRSARDGLELQVDTRTAELVATNEKLTAQIEERRRAEAARNSSETALRESLENFAKAFETSPIAMAITTEDEGRCLEVNAAFLRLLGREREEVIGRPSWEIGVFSGLEERDRMRNRLLAEGHFAEIELPVRTRSGDERICRFSAETIEISGVRRFLCGLRDVTETRRAEKLITHLAYHDSLTGLPNRFLLKDRFDQALLRAQRQGEMLGILFLDLDRFKVVNDNLGHAAGDRFLRWVAERLVRSVRACDTVMRLGGDEFVVLLGEIEHPQDVARVARKILDNLARPCLLDQREVFATASVGASIYPVDGTDAETLLRHADLAMYRAKSRGGDSFQLFTPTMDRRGIERLGVEAELHRALRGGEFVVYYQPQLTLASHRIECVEALVRWRHPTRGVLLPRSFMRVAEETGLIVPIDLFVLRQACRDLVAWDRAGLPPVKVAVNVSPRQFQHADFAHRVREVIEESGADPHLLDLEINEKVALSSIRRHRRTIAEIKALGLCLSLDDFGHGRSTLSHLRELPIETVKIDRSFIRKTTRDPRDAAIARALISMAHALRLRVVAEGVDSPPVMDFLRAEGCDSVQGFYFSRPVPAPMLEELLSTWSGEAAPRLAS
jgi:diguanylate cyclase (GGDEF)-like protein/PAS domain S-box-containing protein